MLGRAFQYGNYMKVIELSRFVDHCQRYSTYTTQLAHFQWFFSRTLHCISACVSIQVLAHIDVY